MISKNILSPKVQALVGAWLSAIPVPEGRSMTQAYADMIATHPVASAANELRLLLGLSFLKEYSHPDADIEQEVRASILSMQGSWKNVVLGMMNYLCFGYSYTEYSCDIKNKKATLSRIQTLDPRHYVFEGTYGNITRVHYSGQEDIYIPYEQGVHLINQPYIALGGNPYGIAICRKAYPYVELWKIVMAQATIMTKRQATKLLVGKTNTANNNVYMPDETTGLPIRDEQGRDLLFNQGYVLQKKLEQVENNSFVVLGLEDEIEAVSHETDGAFVSMLLTFLESMIFLCWLVPKTVTSTGGSTSGDSNLNEGHRELLEEVNISEMKVVAEALIESIIKPILIFNYGEMESYGTFPVVKDEEDEDSVQLLNAIASLLDKGFLDSNEIALINRIRGLIKIPLVEENELPIPNTELKKNFFNLNYLWKNSTENPTFRWNKGSQRYHYTSGEKKGKFVGYAKTIEIVETAISKGKESGLNYTNQLLSGKISVATWEGKIAQDLRNLSVYQYGVGIGGLKDIEWKDNAIITGQLNFQLQHLREFSKDILAGKLSEAQIKARLNLYYSDTRGLFELGRRQGHKTNGYLWEIRSVTPGENCESCLRYQSYGWVEIGILPMIGEQCECKANCNCIFKYSKQLVRPKK